MGSKNKTIILIFLIILLISINVVFFTSYFYSPIKTEYSITEIDNDSSFKISLFVKAYEDLGTVNGEALIPESFELVEGQTEWQTTLSKNQEKEFTFIVRPRPSAPPYGYGYSDFRFSFKNGEYSQEIKLNGKYRYSQEAKEEDIEYSYSNKEELLKEYRKNVQNPEWLKNKRTVCHQSCFVPEPRKGEESNKYFRSLNLTEDEVYVVILFELSEENLGYGPSERELSLIFDQGASIVEDKNMQITAKIPRSFLENGPSFSWIDKLSGKGEDFEFMRWIGIIEAEEKIGTTLKNNHNNPVDVIISSYDKFSKEERNVLKSFSKGFFDESDKVVNIRIDLESVDRIAQINFVKKMEVASKPVLH